MRILAVDIGQSGSRLRSGDGFNFSGGPAFDRTQSLVANVAKVLEAASAPESDVVVLSMTGLRGIAPDPDEIGDLVHSLTRAHHVGIADDGFAAHAGALGGADGIAIAVGSGVVSVARHKNKASHRDGDGPILGDDGSGFWIGRKGLRAALRAYEDRGPATQILHAIEKTHGSVYQAIRTKSDADLMRWCLDVTPIVLKGASENDAVAVQIRNEAAQRLAQTASSAWRAVGKSDADVKISYTGAVMHDAGLKEAFAHELGLLLPHVQWVEPLGDNLDGALAVARAEQIDIPPLLRWWHH